MLAQTERESLQELPVTFYLDTTMATQVWRIQRDGSHTCLERMTPIGELCAIQAAQQVDLDLMVLIEQQTQITQQHYLQI
jgi:hypothetical protein